MSCNFFLFGHQEVKHIDGNKRFREKLIIGCQKGQDNVLSGRRMYSHHQQSRITRLKLTKMPFKTPNEIILDWF